VLWPKGDMPATFVDKVVHLFGDHIGGITQALKDPEIFEHRGNDAFVST
jgi:hypothetical protein